MALLIEQLEDITENRMRENGSYTQQIKGRDSNPGLLQRGQILRKPTHILINSKHIQA